MGHLQTWPLGPRRSALPFKADIGCGRAHVRDGGHEPTCAPSLRQLVEERLGLLQVQRVKALGEPAVDRRQQLVGFGPPSLLAP